MHRIELFKNSREILEALVELELRKEAEAAKVKEINQEDVLDAFAALQNAVLASPELKNTFIKLQKKFAMDPDFAAKTDPNFVQGVMLLDLDQE